MRPPDLEAAVLLFKAVFGPDVTVFCSFCQEHEAEPADTWCWECNDLCREHGGPLPLSVESRPEPAPGICGWYTERPAVDDSRLCLECNGSEETAAIGVPITDAEVRRLGFIPTGRGWVPRTAELRERLDAADRARTAERELEDERIRHLSRVLAELRRQLEREGR